ncbi:MAG: VWA domain-containing protein [Planctomycetes bacterium]|nr:VWA domain-containing protein [Planctomycetota bacterium]
MIQFALPEAFLLVPLAALLLRRRLWPRPLLGTLRVLCLLALCALLASPYRPGAEDGRDLVLVLDRSRSMPAASLAAAQELADGIAAGLQPGDRLGVVTFGRKPAIERVPQRPFSWPQLGREVDVDGSDLAAAVGAGLTLVPPGRQGSLLVFSDGEANGGDLEGAARAAVRAGVRVDTHFVARGVGADLAVADLSVPAQIPVGEPFAVTAVVTAGTAGPARFSLFGDGEVVRAGEVQLQAGRNVLQFRRVLQAAGLHEVAIEVQRDDDPVPGNNRGLAVVRGEGGTRMICVTPGGREDRLTRTLRALGIDVVVAAPQSAPLTLQQLDAVRCVILEDVAAGDLPAGAMPTLAHWVRELGGGLLMTGGKSSFGVGGYHRSPVEDVLPVTMELREEQRRFGLAMAIALDRSGSMQADAGGTTKMQLADRGAATAVELLSPIDAVAVLAVDSAAHVVVPLQSAKDKRAIADQVRQIESAGGGIYVDAALQAAAAELKASTQQNRHIVLFADAADAEQPGDYKTFVPELAAAGITVSVIGLGTPADSDADLLVDIARLGKGRCHFVAEAADLPRVFAQETIQVARSAMVEEETQVRALPPLAALGDMPLSFPTIGGYSVAWQRPRGELALQTANEQHSPVLSYWQIGLGRAAALLAEVDGAATGPMADWPELGTFLGTLVRWLGGGQLPGVYVDARRDGADGLFTIEVEESQATLLDRVRGVLSPPEGRAAPLAFERTGPARLVARVPLSTAGVYRAALQVDDAVFRLPPLALPYSPELAPVADPRGGERTLRRLATTTGGTVQPSVEQVLTGDRRSWGRQDFGPWCGWTLLALWLLEIAVRRFHLTLPTPAFLQPREPVPKPELRDAPRPAPRREVPPPPPPAAAAEPESPLLDAITRAQRRSRRR